MDFDAFNQALLVTQAWWILTILDSLCAHVLQTRSLTLDFWMIPVLGAPLLCGIVFCMEENCLEKALYGGQGMARR